MSYTFNSAQLREITGPGVYIFWRGDRPIYIGASIHGFGRCCSGGHKMHRFLGESDISLTFEPMLDGQSAFAMEERLIVEYQPEFNTSELHYLRDLQRRQKARYREKKERKIEYWYDQSGIIHPPPPREDLNG